MNILILEDDQQRIDAFNRVLSNKHKVLVVNTAADAIALIAEGEQDVIFLDHDLGGKQGVPTSDKNTGSEVVRQMLQMDMPLNQPYVIVHSMNSVAGNYMANDLRKRFDYVYRITFDRLVSSYFDDPSFLS